MTVGVAIQTPTTLSLAMLLAPLQGFVSTSQQPATSAHHHMVSTQLPVLELPWHFPVSSGPMHYDLHRCAFANSGKEAGVFT